VKAEVGADDVGKKKKTQSKVADQKWRGQFEADPNQPEFEVTPKKNPGGCIAYLANAEARKELCEPGKKTCQKNEGGE